MADFNKSAFFIPLPYAVHVSKKRKIKKQNDN